MEITFFIISAVLIGSGLSVIFQKNPMASAISLIVNLLSMAVLYFFLGNQLLGATQMIIYAGAIVVLFLFVIMIFGNKNLPEEFSRNILVFFIPVIFTSLIVFALFFWTSNFASVGDFKSMMDTKVIAKTLFTKYLLPFELISVLFLIGIIAVFVFVPKFSGSREPVKKQ